MNKIMHFVQPAGWGHMTCSHITPGKSPSIIATTTTTTSTTTTVPRPPLPPPPSTNPMTRQGMAPTQPKHAEMQQNATTMTPAKRDATTHRTWAEGTQRAIGGQGNGGRVTGRWQEGQQAQRTRYTRLFFFFSILLLTSPIPIPLPRTQKTCPYWVCLSCSDSYLHPKTKNVPNWAHFSCSAPPFHEDTY